MESFRYIQDGGKNYLKSEEISRVDYITAMLIHNEIPAFAQTRFKSLNAENYICYDMNGLIPISQSLEINKLNAERVESFLRSIIRVYQSMEEFMLPFDRLIVDEAYIYENYNSKEFCWIYGNNVTESNFTGLFEKLLDRIDYKDDRVVKIMYSMYQAAKDSEEIFNRESGGSSILKIKEKAEEIMSLPYQSLDLRAKELMRSESRKFDLNGENLNEINRMKNLGYDEAENNSDSMARRYREDIEKQKMKRDIEEYYEERIEKITERKKTNEKNEGSDKKKNKKIDVKTGLKKVWNYLNADIGSKAVVEQENIIQEEEPSYNIREVHRKKSENRAGEENPTTLLTGAMIGNGVYCLKSDSINDDNILLTEFPFFIGKSGENTNHRIDDSTVSRFHVRMDKEDDELWLTDLNSTNGTFLNGIRMIPYDRVKVGSGDSIVISRKRYELRYLG